jgi:hypothetical protein
MTAPVSFSDWKATQEPNLPDDLTPEQVQSLLSDLLDDVLRFFLRYVHFTTEQQSIAVTLWTVYTHCFGEGQPFSWVPYLLATSAEPGSGKTTLVECVARLAYKPLRAETLSPAMVGREVGGRTLLLDEIDGVYKGRPTDGDGSAMDLRTILNGGFGKDGIYGRLVQIKGGAFEPHYWSTFSPKMLAGIGRTVPDTVKSRSIPVRLERMVRTQAVEKMRDRAVTAIALPLKERIIELTRAIGDLPYVDDLPMELNNREGDIWEPLIALASLAGPLWEASARGAAVRLSESEPFMSNGVRLLSDLRDLFLAAESPVFMSTKELIGRPEDPDDRWGHEASGLCAVEDFSWGAWTRGRPLSAPALAGLLSEYDIKSDREMVGRHGYGPSGYFRKDLEPAWERYLDQSAEAK